MSLMLVSVAHAADVQRASDMGADRSRSDKTVLLSSAPNANRQRRSRSDFSGVAVIA